VSGLARIPINAVGADKARRDEGGHLMGLNACNSPTAVYAAEAEYRRKGEAAWDFSVRQLSPSAAQRFCDEACKQFDLEPILIFKRWERGGMADFDDQGRPRIHLHPQDATPIVILHEIAHHLDDEIKWPAHSRLWVANFLRLVRFQLGERTAGELAVAMQDRGVKGVYRSVLEIGLRAQAAAN
jgi:hypothetical protein